VKRRADHHADYSTAGNSPLPAAIDGSTPSIRSIPSLPDAAKVHSLDGGACVTRNVSLLRLRPGACRWVGMLFFGRGHRTQKKAVSKGARYQYLACLAGMFGLASLGFRGTPGAWRWRNLSGMPHAPF